MQGILERFRSQKREATAVAERDVDGAIAAALAGNKLSPEQLSLVDEQELALAERRSKECARMADGDQAATQLPATQQKLVEQRETLRIAQEQLNAKHAPAIDQSQRDIQQLNDRQAAGSRSRTWLTESCPEHVNTPLRYLRKQLVREESYLSNNQASLHQAKTAYERAKAGSLPYPDALSMSSGSKKSINDNRERRQRDEAYSDSMVGRWEAEVDRNQQLCDEVKARVDGLRSQIEQLESLQLTPWPSRAAVTAILGSPWDSEVAAANPIPDVISTAFGTPSAVRV